MNARAKRQNIAPRLQFKGLCFPSVLLRLDLPDPRLCVMLLSKPECRRGIDPGATRAMSVAGGVALSLAADEKPRGIP